MKCIRKADRSTYIRVSNEEAEQKVSTGEYVYTTKSAFKSSLNKTRKRFYNFKEFPGERTNRKLFKKLKKPRISNANSTKGTKALIQRVTNKPERMFVERYLPKGAIKKIKAGLITKEGAMKTLAKNRYIRNFNIEVVKTIKHIK